MQLFSCSKVKCQYFEIQLKHISNTHPKTYSRWLQITEVFWRALRYALAFHAQVAAWPQSLSVQKSSEKESEVFWMFVVVVTAVFNLTWFTLRRTWGGLFALLWVWSGRWSLIALLGFCMLQIRKRRPTPASLVIMNEHVPPGKCQHTI